jgi:hypothetical protein
MYHSFHQDDNGNIAVTLWPSFEVRSRWIQSIENACTTSELAILLRHLEKQCKAFGLGVEDRVEAVESSRQQPKSKTTQKKASLKKGGKGMKMDDFDPDSFRDRPVRAAAKVVKSYAE